MFSSTRTRFLGWLVAVVPLLATAVVPVPAITSAGAQTAPAATVAPAVESAARVVTEPETELTVDPDGGQNRPERVGELTERRTVASRTFELADGSFETVVSPTPLFTDIDGRMVQIDGLESAYSGFTAGTTAGGVFIPDDLVVVDVAGGAVAWNLAVDNDLVLPVLTDFGEGVVRFGTADSGVLFETSTVGVKETVILDEATDSIVWDLQLTDGLVAEQVDTAVTITGRDGTVVAVLPAPFLQDADGAVTDGIVLRLEASGNNSYTYALRLPADWLAGAAFPVLLDPSITLGADRDCTLKAGSSTLRCGWDSLRVSDTADDRNAVLRFDLADAMAAATRNGPASIRIAELGLAEKQVYTTGNIAVRQVTQDWDGINTTWATASTGTAWSTAGGTIDPADLLAATEGVTGTDSWSNESGRRYWYLTEQAQDWLYGDDGDFGVLLTATDPGTDMAFWSANASNPALRPELRIRW